ncbi:cleavage stimulation factor subunit 3 [Pancytospora philotis]|nr:cleavage stimulation factor subunit 3 [Pancytospora philotis]
MEEAQQSREPETQDELYKLAQSYYNGKLNKELERLFSRYLKKSYDLRLWNLYVEYVKRVSVKKVNIGDVYAFVLQHFEHSYFTVDLVREYIAELDNLDDEALCIEKTRKIYQSVLATPVHGLSQLWSEYEKWELSVNRSTARGIIEQMQPVYSNAASVYQRLLAHIQADSYFKILDIELENPLKLSKSAFSARLGFIFNFYTSKLPGVEALRFLHSFYMKEAVKPAASSSLFISIWYSFLYGKNFFNFDDKENFDLVCINYFNWIIKNEGIEAYRLKFAEVRERVGHRVFIYVANVEYYHGGSKEAAYQIFQEACAREPENPQLAEEFLGLFLKIGDDDNIRGLFKKLGKTERMWAQMIEYEFQHGDFDAYRALIAEREEARKRQELLPPAPVVVDKIKANGTQGIYEEVLGNFGYMDLQFATDDLLAQFLERLPKIATRENIFANVDFGMISELLAGI